MDEETKPINPNPPTIEEVLKSIKAFAMVIGKTKTEILKMIKEEWLYGHPELIKQAEKELWSVFEGREKMPRRVIRAGRRENHMTFSDIVRKKLK